MKTIFLALLLTLVFSGCIACYPPETRVIYRPAAPVVVETYTTYPVYPVYVPSVIVSPVIWPYYHGYYGPYRHGHR